VNPNPRQPKQHPLIAEMTERAKQSGAATYSGRSFLTASWEGGKRLEVRVDIEDANTDKGQPR